MHTAPRGDFELWTPPYIFGYIRERGRGSKWERNLESEERESKKAKKERETDKEGESKRESETKRTKDAEINVSEKLTLLKLQTFIYSATMKAPV